MALLSEGVKVLAMTTCLTLIH